MSLDRSRPTDAMLDLAIELADQARVLVQPRFRTPLTVDDKSDGTPVTEVDRQVEAALRKHITAAFPDHGIVGEEAGMERSDAEWVWVIDPIDGTKSFVLGKPTFATLIGLMHRGRPVLGVIEHPALNDRWVGAHGRPTTLNGAPVSTRPCDALDRAALSATGPDLFTGVEIPAFARLAEAVRLQHYGADCHAFGLLAAGFIDLVVESQHQLHDFCALVPVVEGAGGAMTDWRGMPLEADSGPRVIAAGDRRLHAAALEILNVA